MDEVSLRVIIFHLMKKGLSNREIEVEINEVHGHGTISLRTVQKWTHRYAAGDESFDDKPRSGRPPKDDLIPAVTGLLDDDPFLSQKKIAKYLGVHPHTVNRILTQVLGLTRVRFRWIPYALNDEQKQNRVDLSIALVEILESASIPQLKTIITGDETWVYMRNPRSAMWIGTDIPIPEQPKITIGVKKVMISVFWSPSGMHLIKMLPPGERFTKQYFIDEILNDLYQQICNRRPKKKTKGYFLHFDNARPHCVDDILSEMGFQRLPHPAFSPDLAPTDFFLFGHMKGMIEGLEFESPEQLLSEVTRKLRSIATSVLTDAYSEWMRRLRKCIELGGEYIS
jgi:histone-lysine N-methyltransferase SETMAR